MYICFQFVNSWRFSTLDAGGASSSMSSSFSLSSRTWTKSLLRDITSVLRDSYTSLCWMFSLILARSFSHLFSSTVITQD